MYVIGIIFQVLQTLARSAKTRIYVEYLIIMSLQIKFQQIHGSNKTVTHFKETSTCIIDNEDNICRCLPNGFSREKKCFYEYI